MILTFTHLLPRIDALAHSNGAQTQRSAAHPRTTLQKMREGALKCQGPALVGLVLCLFCRKRWYFILWRTRPPEIVISSERTTTCGQGHS